jgi:hypothetical protein
VLCGVGVGGGGGGGPPRASGTATPGDKFGLKIDMLNESLSPQK